MDFNLIVNSVNVIYVVQSFYLSTVDPLDLSKITLNLHTGIYQTLIDFSKDVRSMFDSYKKFFNNSSSEVSSFRLVNDLQLCNLNYRVLDWRTGTGTQLAAHCRSFKHTFN